MYYLNKIIFLYTGSALNPLWYIYLSRRCSSQAVNNLPPAHPIIRTKQPHAKNTQKMAASSMNRYEDSRLGTLAVRTGYWPGSFIWTHTTVLCTWTLMACTIQCTAKRRHAVGPAGCGHTVSPWPWHLLLLVRFRTLCQKQGRF